MIALGVFIDDRLVASVPESDDRGKATLKRVSTLLGRPQKDFKVEMVCPDHPSIPSVICYTCNRSSHEAV